MIERMTIRNASLAVLLLTAGAVPLLAADLEWQTHTSEAGRYTIKFPAAVTVKEPVASASLAGTNAVFRITYSDTDKDPGTGDEAFQGLREVVEKFAKAQGVEVQAVKKAEFEKRASMFFEFTKQRGQTTIRFHQWFIADGKRLYQLLYVDTDKNPVTDTGEAFFKSFKINAP